MITYSGVAVPKVHVDVRQGVAGVGVNHLDVHVERDTWLGLDDVLADKLAADICCSLARLPMHVSQVTNSKVPE